MTLRDGMCHEKEKEDLPVFKTQRIEDYIKKKHGRRLITAIRNNRDITSINRTKITRKQKWKERQLYGYFKRQISEISREKKTWVWLKKENIERKSESHLIAAQNNTIRTMPKQE